MQLHTEEKLIRATFANLRLKNFQRRRRTNVLEDKSYFLFTTEIKVAGMTFPVLTLSLPVVLLTHSKQECSALATILWDNFFAEVGKFKTPEKGTLREIISMLSMKWMKHCNTGFSDGNVLYLASKLLKKNPSWEDINGPGCMVTWYEFSRKELDGHKFSFWLWFYNIMKLTEKYFSDAWGAGYILGFASKDYVKEILSSDNYVYGTFILRFSDSSEDGGLTLAYKKKDEITGKHNIIMAEPFDSNILDQRSLADTLLDQKSILTFVYTPPNPVPLESAFRRKPTAATTNTLGYVKVNLRVVVGKYLHHLLSNLHTAC